MPNFSPSLSHENARNTLTAEQIDNLVMSWKTTLESIGFWYTTVGNSWKLPGGWNTKWINTQWMGNHGQLIIVPWDPRTYKLYGYAMEQKAKNAWLDSELASIWASSKVWYKNELLDSLVTIVKDPQLFLAYLDFPDDWDHKAIPNWIIKHNITEEHSAFRRQSLKSLLLEFCKNSNALPYSQEVKSAISWIIKTHVVQS